MTGIVGSGFGLYGYLPAVLMLEDKVTLLTKSKERFFKRTELLTFNKRVVFIDEEDIFFQSIDTLILSIPPFVQEKIIDKALLHKNIRCIFLEKPLATTPKSAIEQQSKLDVTCGIKYAIGYSFLYTEWFESIKKMLSIHNESVILEINWVFKASHYVDNSDSWKRYVSDGGGVIRFYGIHLIAVLAELNFTQILSSEVSGYSKNELFEWNATFENTKSGSKCLVYVNSDIHKSEKFSVSVRDTGVNSIDATIVNQSSPFGDDYKVKDKIDLRVPLIAKYISKVHESYCIDQTPLYQNINILWNKIEETSSFTPISIW